MTKFSISRINTEKGIFRLSGAFSLTALQPLSYESADAMGTDGWLPLDLNKPYTQSLLKQIQIEVIAHLS